MNIEFPAGLAEAIAARVIERIGDQPEPYLDVAAAAEYLACKPKRIYELKAQGRLAHFKDGSRLLFTRKDLDAALQRVTDEDRRTRNGS
jgi:excisionase family DNA binding protein